MKRIFQQGDRVKIDVSYEAYYQARGIKHLDATFIEYEGNNAIVIEDCTDCEEVRRAADLIRA